MSNKRKPDRNIRKPIRIEFKKIHLESKQFKHNNMVPFNGGKVKGNTYHANIAESVLDNMIGSGSQVMKKIEQAPLFKPAGAVHV